MLRTLALAGVLLLASCGDDELPAEEDAGVSVDAGVDAGSPPTAVTVRLLGITDFHGRLLPPEGRSAGGVAYLATHLAALEAEHPSLVVSAGDLIGASTLDSALLRDEPTIDAMDLLGLDVATVGNHEFDRPLAELERLVGGGCHADGCADDARPYDGASFDVLGANVVDVETGEPVLPPYVVREIEGVRIAFVGATLEGTGEIVFAPFVEGLRFEDEADTINALVPTLRADGATVIVALLHQGLHGDAGYEGCLGAAGPAVEVITRLDPAVDVVFMGHTHQRAQCRYDAGPLVVQAGSWGEVVAVVDLEIDPDTGEVLGSDSVLHSVDREVDPDPEMEAYLAWLDGIVGPLRDREVARITADVSNVPDAAGNIAAGYLVADAFVAETMGDADFGFTNQGGLRTALLYEASADETEDGIVTYEELFALIPFGNTVVTVTLTGAQVEAVLEQQLAESPPSFLAPSAELAYTWDSTRDPGDRIDPAEVLVDGVALDPAASYRVAINSFIAEGGAGFEVFLEGTDRTGGRVDLDAVVDYLETSSPYTPPVADRITRR